MVVKVGDKKYLVGTTTLVEITDVHEGAEGCCMVASARVITASLNKSKYKAGDTVKERSVSAFVDKPGH